MSGLSWVLVGLLFVEMAFLCYLFAGWVLSELFSRNRTGNRQARPLVEEPGSGNLQTGDVILVKPGQVIPGDGEIVRGVASVDESAITGVSTLAIRGEPGGGCSEVIGGTQVVSGSILVRLSARPR
jgi:K+-transporting ATPase ATPase B chain